ncbi:MAG: mycofactocin biosynthesis glycosyltransferase MftF [Acidimicrobiales bacterium]
MRRARFLAGLAGGGRGQELRDEIQASLGARAVLDRRTRVLAGRSGRVLLGGEPFRLLKLTAVAQAALQSGEERLVERLVVRLVAAGLAHPTPPPVELEPGRVKIVVPARDDSEPLAALLRSLGVDGRAGAECPSEGSPGAGFSAEVVVVDDGSLEPVRGAAVRHAVPLGPAAARNAARPLLGEGAEFVFFLDADCEAAPSVAAALAGHFGDPAVGAVAPRVRPRALATPARLASYEASGGSPLDLGPDPGVVGAHRRISYVPSAAILCRREALDAVGWFDEGLRVGEDVDLLRRLEAGGFVVRYDPRAEVTHRCRPDVFAFARQRFSYGRSTAALHRRHPGTVASFEAGTWAALGDAALAGAMVLAGVGCRPGGAVCIAALAVGLGVPARALGRHLGEAGVGWRDALPTAASVVATGQGRSLAGVHTALRRAWWPVLLAAAAVSPRRARRCLLLMLAFVAVPRRPAASRSIALSILDDGAHCCGLWAGCAAEGSLGALLPRLYRRGDWSPSSTSSS